MVQAPPPPAPRPQTRLSMDNNLSPRPSKSERKREMLALQELGELLVKLPESELNQIPLSPLLSSAILEAKRLKTHEAIRRQLQYIGKIMRDEDVTSIQEHIQNLYRKNQTSKAKFHQIEKWRDKLIKEQDTAINDFLEKYPQADRNHIRQLVKKANEDHIQNKNSGAVTELFRYLKTLLSND